MIQGISHITFIVKDLDRSTKLFQELFDAEVIYDSGAESFSISKERFLMIGSQWFVLMKGDTLTEKTYNHIAFKIPPEAYDDYMEKIKSLGLEIRPPRSRVEGEGQSIYFYDYDNHLFELHTGTLFQRLERYKQPK